MRRKKDGRTSESRLHRRSVPSTNADGKSNAWGVQQNVMKAMARSLEVWRRGHAAVCPHANTMFFQDADGCEDRVWLDGDIEMLRRCDALLTVEGWKESNGATAEVLLAQQIGKPVLTSIGELETYLSQPDGVSAVHRLFLNAVAARLRNVMTGASVEFGIDEGGSAIRIVVDGEAYELEWMEEVVLRRAADYAKEQIAGSIELAADGPCACSVPDFVGYIHEPETYRCLRCGHQPNGSEQIAVRLLERVENRRPTRFAIGGQRVIELWSKAVRTRTAPAMEDIQTFAQLIVDDLRPAMLDLVTHAREDGWKAGLESKHGTV
jgi:hypothetical protein